METKTFADLEQIDGISSKGAKALSTAGITDLHQLREISVDRIDEIIFNSNNQFAAISIQQNVQLYFEKSFLLKSPVTLPPPDQIIFCDIEAEPSKTYRPFLVTFSDSTNKPYSVYKNKFSSFKNKVGTYLKDEDKSIIVASSGTDYDFKRLVDLTRDSIPDFKNLYQSIDLLKLFRKSLVSPVGFSVKKLSHFLGYPDFESLLINSEVVDALPQVQYRRPINKKKTNIHLGYLFGMLYEQRLLTRELKDLLVLYNRLDVESLRFIYLRLYELLNQRSPGKVRIKKLWLPFEENGKPSTENINKDI